ncbi:hypothetical protein H5410_049186 [Solanum commersonii]|uniref:GRF-type domain-containing protein n=1 Tax=Solanum commersonii TaxID=4109 RepID=A0A9J5XNU1_SOLCO|nr:hypothetical protein H5410_049186 [Solanum commersonii]
MSMWGHCGNEDLMDQFNPGRRFLCCKTSKARGGCGYFRWYDDEMPA